MTFLTNMQATEQEVIAELYRIRSGGSMWYYTSYRRQIIWLEDTYEAAPIRRGSFTATKTPGSSKVSVYFPLSDPLKRFISNFPLPKTTVKIYRALGTDWPSSYALLFDGKVMRASISNKVITAECAIDDALSMVMPQVVYQSFCNWQVFDCGCLLAPEPFTVTVAVTVDGRSLISSEFARYTSGHFTGGKVYHSGDYRFITNHAGATIDMQIPFGPQLVTGQSVSVTPGCDGSPETCSSKFNNRDRHLSMPYIPSHNPVLWGFK